MSFGKVLVILIVFASLIASVVLSFKSFTGYLVSDVSDGNANLSSLFFLLVGILGSWVYVRKFKDR